MGRLNFLTGKTRSPRFSALFCCREYSVKYTIKSEPRMPEYMNIDTMEKKQFTAIDKGPVTINRIRLGLAVFFSLFVAGLKFR